MADIVKFEKPKDLMHAVELAHNQKQWASKYSDKELKAKLTSIIDEAGDALRQTRNLSEGEINAIYTGLIDRIRNGYKTLHVYEIERAIKNWIYDGSEETKIFSAASLIKAVSRYDKEQRSAYIKQLWDKQKREEEAPKEYSNEYKERFVKGLYELWKSNNGIVTGYVQAFDFLKDLKEIRVEKAAYWMAINAARDEVLNRLKTDQATRTITGIVYNRSKEALELLTEDNFSEVMRDSQDYNELIAEAKKWLVIMHFQDLMINE